MDAVAHLQHFALRRDPFANDASLARIQETPPFADAARRLRRAVAQEHGLCVLTGPSGSGKTLLVRRVLDVLEEEVHEACMLVPVPGVSDGPWVLDRFARQLGVEAPASRPAERVGQLYEQLAIVREEGRHTVLFVDEAQVLAERGTLGELRGLLNLEYEERRLLTLVLAGLPHLGEAVAREPALAGRVDVRVRLGALAPEAVAGYLAARLRAAGADPALFEDGAVEALASHGAGLPRRINTLADGALFEAFLAGRERVVRPDVERAAAELAEEGRAEAPAAEPPPAEGARASEVDAALDPPTEPPAAPAPAEADELDLEEVVADASEPTVRADATDGLDLGCEEDPPKEDELDGLFADLVDER